VPKFAKMAEGGSPLTGRFIPKFHILTISANFRPHFQSHDGEIWRERVDLRLLNFVKKIAQEDSSVWAIFKIKIRIFCDYEQDTFLYLIVYCDYQQTCLQGSMPAGIAFTQ